MSDTSLPSSIGRMTLCGSSLQVVQRTMRQQRKPHGVRRKRKQAFQREARFFRLDSRASVPKTAFSPTDHWPQDLLVVPEYSFAVDVSGQEIDLSHEHDKVRWLSFKEATRLLTWESNRTALWELNERLNTDQIDELLAVDDRSRPPGHDNVYAIKER